MYIEPTSPITPCSPSGQPFVPQARSTRAIESSIQSLANPASVQDIEKRILELLEQIFALRACLGQDRSRLKNPPNPVPKAQLLEVKTHLETAEKLIAASRKYIQNVLKES